MIFIEKIEFGESEYIVNINNLILPGFSDPESTKINDGDMLFFIQDELNKKKCWVRVNNNFGEKNISELYYNQVGVINK